MRLSRVVMCLVFCCGMAAAQSPETAQYAPRAIVLISGQTGVENVMPLLFTANGQQSIQFVPVSKLKEAFAQGAQPIRLGDMLSLLKQANDKINALQAENDKLWKVAEKDTPKPDANTFLVQQPIQAATIPAPSQAEIEARQQAQFDAEKEARRQRNMLILSMAFRNASNSFAAQQQLLQREQEQLQEQQRIRQMQNPRPTRLQTNCTSSGVGNTVFTNCN